MGTLSYGSGRPWVLVIFNALFSVSLLPMNLCLLLNGVVVLLLSPNDGCILPRLFFPSVLTGTFGTDLLDLLLRLGFKGFGLVRSWGLSGTLVRLGPAFRSFRWFIMP